MRTAFGLDIAGYAGGNSGFARADLSGAGTITVTIYEGHAFGRKLKGPEPLGDVVEAERDLVRACRLVGAFVVDTPVYLQGLPSPPDAFFTWELVKRPVDYAFDALAPLANLIGAPVARFQSVLSVLPEDEHDGDHGVFETYPAATLKLLGMWSSGYGKRSVRFLNGRWEGGPTADIASRLQIVAEEGEKMNGDEFDAAICAITGVIDQEKRLEGDDLSEEVVQRIKEKVMARYHDRISAAVPDNYVLMTSCPNTEVRMVRKLLSGPEDMMEVTA